MMFLQNLTFSPVLVVVAILFLIVGSITFYYATRRLNQGLKENNEFVNSDEVEFIIYHVTWCPYCKQALPIWDITASAYEGKRTLSGKKIKFKKVDCTHEEEDNISHVNGKPVDSFPSIFFNDYENKFVEFKSRCTSDTLKKFVQEYAPMS